MILIPATRQLFAATESVDMRRSFDALIEVAKGQLGLDVLRSAIVLFFNKDRTRCKLLFHDGSGFVILYKRLDEKHFVIPVPVAPGERSVMIQPRELALLLEGRLRPPTR